MLEPDGRVLDKVLFVLNDTLKSACPESIAKGDENVLRFCVVFVVEFRCVFDDDFP